MEPNWTKVALLDIKKKKIFGKIYCFSMQCSLFSQTRSSLKLDSQKAKESNGDFDEIGCNFEIVFL